MIVYSDVLSDSEEHMELQTSRRLYYLREQAHKKQEKAMWRIAHLRAQPNKKQLQTIRRVEHL